MKKNIIKHYLKNYSEFKSFNFSKLVFDKDYEYILCLPVCDESIEIIDCFLGFIQDKSCLLLININQSTPLNSLNQKLFSYLNQHFAFKSSETIHIYQNRTCRYSIIIMDNFSKANLHINPKHGIGMVRKLLADFALHLIDLQRIRQPIIYNTDADVTLPDDYFEQIKTHDNRLENNTSAFVFNFKHSDNGDKISQATWLHENILNYNRLGLSHANSIFDYVALGSIIAIKAEFYAKVRGFPKINFAEDFYLLNKLAKLKSINSLNGNPILIKARLSKRTFFGTGMKVEKILQQETAIKEQKEFFYPELFTLLKKLLIIVKQNQTVQSVKLFIQQYQMCNIFEQLNIEVFYQHCQCNKLEHTKHFLPAWSDWFDSLKTYKFLSLNSQFNSTKYPKLSYNQLKTKQKIPFISELNLMEKEKEEFF